MDNAVKRTNEEFIKLLKMANSTALKKKIKK